MQRVAMYLQDKHEIREGMAYAQYAEQRGFEAMWQANRASCVTRLYQWPLSRQ